MAELVRITEGWSAELGPFIALSDDAGLSLSDYTCVAIVSDKTRTAVTSPGTVRKDSDQTTNPGYWYFTPDPTKFLATGSPYYIHLKVTDGGGKIAYFPNGDADTILVAKP